MKPSTRLSSAVFQLTPTRTRCDLIIISNYKKEKIASGLLNPFLAHLKTAQHQNAKGGYSILLEPKDINNASWFTKATLERFVRFVSTPEILERVYTIETQIMQIEEAIALQSSNDIGQSTVESHQRKNIGSFEGNRNTLSNAEKAIVLYEPGSQVSEAKGSFSYEGDSKVQLLKVLETRKTALQNEQDMAFARAVAAGFDIDHMEPLVAFAEGFGASRLMEACSRFKDLWKKYHNKGQWLETDANKSGALVSVLSNKNNDSDHDTVLESNGKPVSDVKTDEQPPADYPITNGKEKHIQGQNPHLMFPPWDVHAPPGAPPFLHAYPVQGIPYYHAYTGNGTLYQQPHHPVEHSPLSAGQVTGPKRQHIDGRDRNTKSEMWESDRTKSQDDMEVSQSLKKKTGRSFKNQSGMIVIQNVNYVNSEVKKSDSKPSGGSDTDLENEESEAYDLEVLDKKSLTHLPGTGRLLRSKDENNLDNEVSDTRKDNDDGQWQAFQNCLLRGTDESALASDAGIFATEKDVTPNQRANNVTHDPLALGGQDTAVVHDTRINGIHKISGSMPCRPRISSNEFLLSSGNNDVSGNENQMNVQFMEANGRRVSPKTICDDFMIASQGNRPNFGNPSESAAMVGFESSVNNMNRGSPSGIADETFIVPYSSMPINQDAVGQRTVIDLESEIPLKHQESEGTYGVFRDQVNWKPDDLNLMPERGTEQSYRGYDPTMDYEMQVSVKGSTSGVKIKKEVAALKGKINKDSDRRLKVASDSLNKQRTGGPIRKNQSSKMNSLENARERAKQLRSFKADLQKMKKEKEEAELKRLEALKLERQKRISARGSSTSAKLPSPQTKYSPTKLSPITNGGSKFSDSEPGSSSPLQRSKLRTLVRSSESQKAFKASKVSEHNYLPGDKLSRSLPSLSESKRESVGVKQDSKASMTRIRRLSEPKIISSHPITSTKARSAEVVTKRKPSMGHDSSKISAIINLDRSKAAALPELKIKTEKKPLAQNESVVKDTVRLNGVKPSAISETLELNEKDRSLSYQSHVDESTIIEKTVVMLEYEKPSMPALGSSEGKMNIHNQRLDDNAKGKKSVVISQLTATHAPNLSMDEITTNSSTGQTQKKPYSDSVRENNEPPKISDAMTAKKPYQAPYARVSSLEDPCTHNSNYSKAPSVSLQMESWVEETAKARVPDMKTLRLDKNLDSTQVKESSKGFRRLLKFRKKNHSSTSIDCSVESGAASIDSFDAGAHARNNAISNNVDTLKNLISQEETPSIGGVSQKSSRHFSLLPFWSKLGEKKLAS